MYSWGGGFSSRKLIYLQTVRFVRQVCVGDCAEVVKTFTKDDVECFARISMDSNDIHLKDTAAHQAGLKGIVVHGVLCMGLLSAAIGTKIAPGSIYAGQRIHFLRPVYVGDTITARTTVNSFQENKPWIAYCSTQCFNQNKEKVIDGTATVHLPWLKMPE